VMGETRERGVEFSCPERPGVTLRLGVLVVEHLTGGERVEVTPARYARLEELAAANGGAVPLTAREFDALQGGDAAALVELAASPSSNLHPMFCWEEQEAARLYNQARTHGAGN
jgi:hypothetical protein